MEYKRAVINTPAKASQDKPPVARTLAGVVVGALVGVALIYVRVASLFHWPDLFGAPILFHLIWVELLFFILVARRIGMRIARGPGRAKWAIPLAAAVILLAAEVTLYYKAVLPERARKKQETRQRLGY
ncbi:hypothetical protein OJ996_11170 [Luteolibacter sp. GHJ8]|uniref:DUF3817 domain-containing protein n=1 Tax=Luteolibacter rhizosphaerae TaxID=2989719 RepID=A0ABT3G2R8_9BACT|nr:hypothetical protein [Luteolibacter rhizosphaerae]MCW1914140.1 hypothetical protein [Luteolibacter rhizosphaerae]